MTRESCPILSRNALNLIAVYRFRKEYIHEATSAKHKILRDIVSRAELDCGLRSEPSTMQVRCEKELVSNSPSRLWVREGFGSVVSLNRNQKFRYRWALYDTESLLGTCRLLKANN